MGTRSELFDGWLLFSRYVTVVALNPSGEYKHITGGLHAVEFKPCGVTLVISIHAREADLQRPLRVHEADFEGKVADVIMARNC
jgi:hypothetical protein